MRELAEAIYSKMNTPWYHIDWYYYRKTKQEELKALKSAYPVLFKAQDELTIDIIKWLDPKMILVANAYVGELIRFAFQQMKFDNKLGTYKTRINKNRDVPVFFSGMLSGQRALDLGSFERLQWHMVSTKNGKYERLEISD